jgi:hypothetical protein
MRHSAGRKLHVAARCCLRPPSLLLEAITVPALSILRSILDDIEPMDFHVS